MGHGIIQENQGKYVLSQQSLLTGSQSTPWYPLSSEEMVYMCVILTRYSEKENTNNKSKSFGPRRTADSPFLWRADYWPHNSLWNIHKFKFLGMTLPLRGSKINFYEFVLVFLWFTFFLHNYFWFSGCVVLRLRKTEKVSFREEWQERTLSYLICFT